MNAVSSQCFGRYLGNLGGRRFAPALRLIVSQDTTARAAVGDEPIAEVRRINVHVKQNVDGRDRAQLERLCRHITGGGEGLLRGLFGPLGYDLIATATPLDSYRQRANAP